MPIAVVRQAGPRHDDQQAGPPFPPSQNQLLPQAKTGRDGTRPLAVSSHGS